MEFYRKIAEKIKVEKQPEKHIQIDIFYFFKNGKEHKI